jgi:Protein of unknown function (DUF2568)
MELMDSANLILRFSWSYALKLHWLTGAQLPKCTLLDGLQLAITVPLAAAVAWGLIVAPNAPLQVGPFARFGVELMMFAAAIGGLFARPRFMLGLIFALLYIINRALMIIWHQ